MSAPALRVLRGHPTERELAAVALAVARPGDSGDSGDRFPPRPPWLRAARIEGSGGRPVTSAPDLRGRRGRVVSQP